MKLRVILLFSCLFFLQNTVAQHLNQNEAILYNVGISSVFAGVGAIINKKDNEKVGKVFAKGFWQGAIGGALIYGSKNLVREIYLKEKWEYSWYAKIVNSAGTSVVENASLNKNFWEQWHFNIGFNRVEFYAKEKFKIKYKIMPVSLGLTLSLAFGNKFEFKRSLQTGEFVFSTNDLINSRGITYGNVVLVDENYVNEYDLFAHEIIHIYQYYDYNPFNSALNKPLADLSEHSTFFSKLNNIMYFDLQGPLLRGLYLLEENPGGCYFDNFFESEANLFSSRILLCK
ncbi:hypothetical protein [Aquimarina aggregata]|uniref:hypothetical protein n=1 Tax=Aquimarina aggregata TaxID=1642818 RepID=UPI000A798732|nr:hypothetical protein [Aquimarina aggregata]